MLFDRINTFGQSSYSGCDIIPVCIGRNTAGEEKIFTIGDIATLSYSIHQDKGTVRVLGHHLPVGVTRGGITIAGTMIFSVFDRRALWEISNREGPYKRVVKATMLPPFDVILRYANEYGDSSVLSIYGIQIVDEGQSQSVEDMYIENTMSYIAMDIDLLEPAHQQIPGFAEFHRKTREEISQLKGSKFPFDYSYLQRKD